MTEDTDSQLPWRLATFIVLDLEGTGSQHREREGIVEIAAIPVIAGKIANEFSYSSINPEIEIPPVISRIHGLTNADLEFSPTFDVIKDELLNAINTKVLVGHNVRVDYRLLKRKMPDYSPCLILDTKILSTRLWPNESKHNLDTLIERFHLQTQLTDLPIKEEDTVRTTMRTLLAYFSSEFLMRSFQQEQLLRILRSFAASRPVRLFHMATPKVLFFEITMAIIKIGISGAHSTGKTSFIKKLSESLDRSGMSYAIVKDLASRCPLPILHDHTLASALWIASRGISEEVEASHRADIVIVDRSVLDSWVYLMVALNGRLPKEDDAMRKTLQGLIAHWLPTYNLLYCTILDGDIPIENTKGRDLDPTYRQRIASEMIEAVREFGCHARSLTAQNAEMELEFILKEISDAADQST